MFSSHRNNLKAHLSLLERSKCDIVLEPEKPFPILAEILAQRKSLRKVFMPNLDFFLNNNPAKDTDPYPFQGTFEEVKNETFVILHTSGSTGIPKPVHVPHMVFSSQDAQQLIPFLGGKPTWVDRIRGKRLFVGLPLFHAACLAKMAYSVFTGATLVLPPAVPLTADVVNAVFTHANVDCAIVAPSLIIDIYKTPEYLANTIQRVESLAYVGGTVSKTIGDEISSKIELITMFGATETLSHPIELKDDPQDWEYISFSSFAGCDFRPVSDDLYEMIVVRNPELSLFQGVFAAFPKLNEYSTNDLYEAHPTKKGLWKFRMRSDDIICFNNAEKLNPVTMEATITGHPKVQSAVIGGHGQFQACLLLEPKHNLKTPEEIASFIDDVWPTVVEANKDCPAHGRVMKSYIMLTDPARPLPRAGKDTVQRSMVFQLYKHEFMSIYNQYAKPDATPQAIPSENLINGVDQAGPSNRSPSNSSNSVHNSDLAPAQDRIAQQQLSFNDQEIEAVVEKCLRRLLPEMITRQLDEALGNVMVRMAADLLQTRQPNPTVSVNGTGEGEPSLKAVLAQVLSETTYLTGLTYDVNLFESGLDSLQVPMLMKRLNDMLRRRGRKEPITTKLLYDNPSIDQLAQALSGGN